MSPEAQDLITKLLNKDRRARLGAKTDSKEILSHPFFKEIDIKKLVAKELDAPFKPDVKDLDDVSNFDAKYTEDHASESIVSGSGLQKIKEKADVFEKFGLSTIDEEKKDEK